MRTLLLAALAACLVTPAFSAGTPIDAPEPTEPYLVPKCQLTLNDVVAEGAAAGFDVRWVEVSPIWDGKKFGVTKLVMSYSGGHLMIGVERADGCVDEPFMAVPEMP